MEGEGAIPGSRTVRDAKSLDGARPSIVDNSGAVFANLSIQATEVAKNALNSSTQAALAEVESVGLGFLQEAAAAARATTDPVDATAKMIDGISQAEQLLKPLQENDRRTIGATFNTRAGMHDALVDAHKADLYRRQRSAARMKAEDNGLRLAGQGTATLTRSAIADAQNATNYSYIGGDITLDEKVAMDFAFANSALSRHFDALVYKADDPLRFDTAHRQLDSPVFTAGANAEHIDALRRMVRKKQSSENLRIVSREIHAKNPDYMGPLGMAMIEAMAGREMSSDDARQALNILMDSQGSVGGNADAVKAMVLEMIGKAEAKRLRDYGYLAIEGEVIFPLDEGDAYVFVYRDGGDFSARAEAVLIDDVYRVLPTMVNGEQMTMEESITRAKRLGIDDFPRFPDLETAVEYAKNIEEYVDWDGRASESVPAPLPDGEHMDYLSKSPLHYNNPVTNEALDLMVELRAEEIDREEGRELTPTQIMLKIARESHRVSPKIYKKLLGRINISARDPDDETLQSIDLIMMLQDKAGPQIAAMGLNEGSKHVAAFVEQVRRFRFGVSPTALEEQGLDFDLEGGLIRSNGAVLREHMSRAMAFEMYWDRKNPTDPKAAAALQERGVKRALLSGEVGEGIALNEMNRALGTDMTQDEMGFDMVNAIKETAIRIWANDPGLTEPVAFWAATQEWVYQRGYFASAWNSQTDFLGGRSKKQFTRHPIDHPSNGYENTIKMPDGSNLSYEHELWRTEAIYQVAVGAQSNMVGEDESAWAMAIEEAKALQWFNTGFESVVPEGNLSGGPLDYSNATALLPPVPMVGPMTMEQRDQSLGWIVYRFAEHRGVTLGRAWGIVNTAVFGLTGPGAVNDAPFNVGLVGDRMTKFGKTGTNAQAPLSWNLVANFTNGASQELIDFGGATSKRLDFKQFDKDGRSLIMNPALREWMETNNLSNSEVVQSRLDKALLDHEKKRSRDKPFRRLVGGAVHNSMLDLQLAVPFATVQFMTAALRGEFDIQGFKDISIDPSGPLTAKMRAHNQGRLSFSEQRFVDQIVRAKDAIEAMY